MATLIYGGNPKASSSGNFPWPYCGFDIVNKSLNLVKRFAVV